MSTAGRHNKPFYEQNLSKPTPGRPPGQGCQSGSKNSLEFRHVNAMKCLRFVWTTVSDCRKQTRPPDAGNNLQKSHFIMCHMTKYSTILGVFQQPWHEPWPGVSPIRHFERGEGPGDEVVKFLVGPCSNQRASKVFFFIYICFPSSPSEDIRSLSLLAT